MLLGDLGADVIKVERPGAGDDTRAWGPPWRDGESTYYLGAEPQERSLVLDLSDEADREAGPPPRRARRRAVLPSRADGALGLDGDTLRARNPGLVSCSVTAFGRAEAARGCPATTSCCRRWAG